MLEKSFPAHRQKNGSASDINFIFVFNCKIISIWLRFVSLGLKKFIFFIIFHLNLMMENYSVTLFDMQDMLQL